MDAGQAVMGKGKHLFQLDSASLLKLQLQTVWSPEWGLEDDVKRYTILTEADAVQGVQLEKSKMGLEITTKFQRATFVRTKSTKLLLQLPVQRCSNC